MELFKQITVLLCILSLSTNASMIGDFLAGAASFWPRSKDLSVESKLKTVPKVQFELPAENEEFLKEGLALIDAPRESLDLCTHRVVQTLKKDCNKLNLEEVSKLAVMMLNCQLEVEGRQTFSCKPEMTLSQCTLGMDSQMHQIYNYMTHRAVGVCSAMKTDQFRAMSEITVNRLMEASQAQLVGIHESLKNQKRLNEMELENMKEFKENDGKIKESQVESLEKLKLAESLIDESLNSLHQDLELRQKSEEKLSNIDKVTEDISIRLVKHSTDLHEEHEKLMKEIDEIQANLQHHNLQLLQQYNETLEFLTQFKSVMLVLSSIATNIKSYVDSIFATLHDAGLQFSDDFIAFMFLNLVYFTSGMVFLLFLNVQGSFCKFLLVALFLFNNVAVYNKAEIDLFPLNIFVWLSYLVLKFLKFLKNRITAAKFTLPKFFKLRRNEPESSESDSDEEELLSNRQLSVAPVPRSPPQPAIRVKTEVKRQSTYRNSFNSHDDNEMTAIFRSSPQPATTTTFQPVVSSTSLRSSTPMSADRPMTPAMRRILSESVSQPDRSATPFMNQTGRVQCQAMTMKGAPCKNAALPGANKCRVHN